MSQQTLYTKQIKEVSSFNQLVNTPFKNDNNALCFSRNLEGNFKEIVDKIELQENITNVSIEQLLALPLSAQAQIARKTIINDIEQLTQIGALPSLNLLKCYERDTSLDYISTDVYSYHVDRSPIPTDTYLCTYYGATSDILPNHQAVQMVQIPHIRQKLKDLHNGPENQFEAFLEEYFFDLHYQPTPNAQPINMQMGHLWRLAVNHPTQQVAPCIHRAPLENLNQYRLLLIC